MYGNFMLWNRQLLKCPDIIILISGGGGGGVLYKGSTVFTYASNYHTHASLPKLNFMPS